MSDRKDAQEPSMEEILSSIRRIIADDQEEPKKPAATPFQPAADEKAKAAAPAEEEDDVLELTEVVSKKSAETPPAPAVELHPPQPAAPQKPARGLQQEVGKIQPAKDMPKEGPKVAAQDSEHLVSQNVANASTSALAKLTRAVAPEDRPVNGNGGKTIEQLVVELMRPMLKDWLDQNLPGIVERVVEQEVKKLARRAELL
ncbi:DUF2497 domain-containing protein [Marinimicrococcus flavescens]|uniref:DUF2497 domain-containing protein n=1 Tax=Marinimicrococcus flavescens TaxID=3031815 RepID=A0AAP4D4Y4_9PROT|nr:DUF2497 domain-containing protein [Marinimicrococcus flavescens]